VNVSQLKLRSEKFDNDNNDDDDDDDNNNNNNLCFTVLTQQNNTNHSHNVCVVTWLLAGRSGVRVLEELRHFSLLQIVQTDCGIHPAATQGIVALFPGEGVEPGVRC
jgi:hypothetical protein